MDRYDPPFKRPSPSVAEPLVNGPTRELDFSFSQLLFCVVGLLAIALGLASFFFFFCPALYEEDDVVLCARLRASEVESEGQNFWLLLLKWRTNDDDWQREASEMNREIESKREMKMMLLLYYCVVWLHLLSTCEAENRRMWVKDWIENVNLCLWKNETLTPKVLKVRCSRVRRQSVGLGHLDLGNGCGEWACKKLELPLWPVSLKKKRQARRPKRVGSFMLVFKRV